jgi:predicted ATPase
VTPKDVPDTDSARLEVEHQPSRTSLSAEGNSSPRQLGGPLSFNVCLTLEATSATHPWHGYAPRMTRVVAFSIDGLAGRDDGVECELHPDINIFFGLNGTGKTSLLKLLASAIRDDVALIRRVPFESATVVFATGGDEIVTRSIDRSGLDSVPQQAQFVQQFGGTQYFVPPMGPQPGWNTAGASNPGSQPCTYLPTSRLLGDQYTGVMNDSSPYSEARMDQIFAMQVTQRWQLYSNQLLSQIRQRQEAGLANILGTLFNDQEPTDDVQLIETDTAYQEAKDFLARQSIRLKSSKKGFAQRYDNDRRLQAVVRVIDAVETELARIEEPRSRLEELVKRFISTNKTIEFDESQIYFTASGQSLSIDLLSSGEKQLIRILVEALANGENSMMIDEPELSMHIDWQLQLVEALHTVNPDAQAILATHSPEIMADVLDEKIFRL